MVGAALDFLFDVLCERALLAVGARTLWVLQLGRRPLGEQMQHSVANVTAGLLLWAGLIAGVIAVT